MTAKHTTMPSRTAEIARPLATGYIRLSKETKASNWSRQGMIDEVTAKIHSLGCDVHSIHVDDGLSGAIRDRPEFLAWLDDARSGAAHVMVPFHGDRITREGMNAAALVLDVIEGKDSLTGKVVRPPVRFVSVDGLDSDEPESFRWRFLIQAEGARIERMRIVARNTDTQARIRKAKRYRGGYVPYGYTVAPAEDGHGKVLVLEPKEARIVLEAAAYILAGNSLYSCVKMLNAKGHKPRRAAAWSAPSLKLVLTGEPILGRMSHRGTVMRDDSGMPITAWPEVLGLDVVERLRAKLNTGKVFEKRVRGDRLLSGMLVCGTCQGKLRVHRTTKNGTVYTRYICVGTDQGRGCTRPVSVKAETLEKHMEDRILDIFGDSPRKVKITRAREAVGLAEIEQALKELSDRHLEVEEEDEEAKIAQQIKGLKAQRKALRNQPVEPVTELVDTGQTNREAWEDNLVKRRELVQWALGGKKITVHPGTPRLKTFEPERFDIPWSAEFRRAIASLPTQVLEEPLK